MKFLRTYFKSIVVYGVVVSGMSALAEWSSFAWLVYGVKSQYVVASVLAFLAGTSVNAVLSRFFAFNSQGRSGVQEAFLIYLTSALAFVLNLGVMMLVVERLGLYLMLGKITGTVAAFFANYLFRQFYIFSSKPRW